MVESVKSIVTTSIPSESSSFTDAEVLDASIKLDQLLNQYKQLLRGGSW